MICDSCNKQLRDGAKFCGQCGAKTKLFASAPVAGTSEQKYELNALSVNATGPDSDGDLSVEIKVSITNRSGSDWDQVNTRTQLISASGFIEDTSDTHDVSVEDGATEEFEINFYGVKARPFMANPELTKTIINVVACSASSKKLIEFALPENSFEVVKMEPCDISDSVRLLSGGIWRTDPDDDKDVRVEAKWLVQNLTDAHIPEVRFTAEVVGKSGAEIGDSGGYEELRPGVSAVISGSTYSKEKKLKGAVVQLGARVISPAATGSSEHIGMEVSALEVAEDDRQESDDEQADNFSSEFHSESDVGSACSRSVSFEWRMESGEVNMDDVEDQDVSAALALALSLAKKEKFEDAVKALPSINFEYSFGNLDSDCSDYFGEPQDISFDLDLSNPKHSVSVGVSDGKLIISITVVFEIPVQDGVVAEEVSEWLNDNGGYAAGFAAGGWSYNGDEGGHMMVAHESDIANTQFITPVLSEKILFEIKMGSLTGGTGLEVKRYLRSDSDGNLSSCVVYIEEWDEHKESCRVRGACYGYAGGGVYEGSFFLIDFNKEQHQVLDYAEAEEAENSQLFDALMFECGRMYENNDETYKLTTYAGDLLKFGSEVEDGIVYLDNDFDGDSLSQVSQNWSINLRFES